MPRNKVIDLITDQEMAFARLVLSGTMTDHCAAETAGLDPKSAAYTKAKPRVRSYMLEHRAAVQQKLVEQDAGELLRFNVGRDHVLNRLWDIANMDPERTRSSMSAQVKALSMIVAIEALIPDRHSARGAVSAGNQPVPSPVNPPFYVSEAMRTQTNGESAAAGPAQAEDPLPPVSSSIPDPTPIELSSRPERSAVERSAVEGPAVGGPLSPSETTSSLPRVPMADYLAPDTRLQFSIAKNRFGRR
jgi:hypothetical protein